MLLTTRKAFKRLKGEYESLTIDNLIADSFEKRLNKCLWHAIFYSKWIPENIKQKMLFILDNNRIVEGRYGNYIFEPIEQNMLKDNEEIYRLCVEPRIKKLEAILNTYKVM